MARQKLSNLPFRIRSNLSVPAADNGSSDVDPIAVVQMTLLATYDPAEGVLGVQAQLTQNSFVLSKNCRLTGGFAFYSWFSGAHAGDFVVSLGGYHPNFSKPA